MQKIKIEAALNTLEQGELPDAESIQLLRIVITQLTEPKFLAGAVVLDRVTEPDRFNSVLKKYQNHFAIELKDKPLADLKSSWNLEAVETILRGLSMAENSQLRLPQIISLLESLQIVGRSFYEKFTPEEQALWEQLQANPNNWNSKKNYHGKWDDFYVGPQVRELHSAHFRERDLRIILELMLSEGDILLDESNAIVLAQPGITDHLANQQLYL